MIRREIVRFGLAALAILALPRAGRSQGAAGETAPLQPVAVVVALEGHVYLLRGGRQVPLQPDAAVIDSDEILTFPDGRVRLRFTDGTLVTIGASSRCLVAFQRRTREQEGEFLRLVEGILRLLTAEAGGQAIQVRTRSAIASPRGTEWIVERKPGSTGVFVIDGQVAVRGTRDSGTPSDGNGVLLDAGEGTDVPDGAPPQPPKRWGPARVDDVLARTTFR